MNEFVTIPEDRMKILKEKRIVYMRRLRDYINVELWLTENDVEVRGDDPMQVIRAKEVVRAFGRGFNFEDALNMVDEEFVLEVINTTEFSGKSKNRRDELKGRVIGAEGRSKNIIEKYSGAKVVVYGKTVSIIGKWENVKVAKEAVEMLLGGAKHAGVFKYLEDRRVV